MLGRRVLQLPPAAGCSIKSSLLTGEEIEHFVLALSSSGAEEVLPDARGAAAGRSGRPIAAAGAGPEL